VQNKSIRVSNYVSGQQECLLSWLKVNKNNVFTGAVNELSGEECNKNGSLLFVLLYKEMVKIMLYFSSYYTSSRDTRLSTGIFIYLVSITI